MGEAKLCGRVKGERVANVGAQNGEQSYSVCGWVFCVFAAVCMLFFHTNRHCLCCCFGSLVSLMLCAWFSMVFVDRPPLVCIRFLLLCFQCHAHGFYGFSRQATIGCYMCVFCVCDAMCMVFLIGFADMLPLVAIPVVLCVFFVLWMLCARFFYWCRRQATISCYMCIFYFAFHLI